LRTTYFGFGCFVVFVDPLGRPTLRRCSWPSSTSLSLVAVLGVLLLDEDAAAVAASLAATGGGDAGRFFPFAAFIMKAKEL
jgi:hypothetical protein